MERRDRVLYIDASAGLSGDMLFSAWLDLGLPPAPVLRICRRLGLPPLAIQVQNVRREGRRAVRVEIHAQGQTALFSGRVQSWIHRVLDARLNPGVCRRLSALLNRLSFAEAAVHRCSPRAVVLRQLAGWDTWVSLVGFCWGLQQFRIREVWVSAIPLGWWHEGHRGRGIPAPGPATQRLLRGRSVRNQAESFEWTTPTGALLATTWAQQGTPPPLRILRAGRGVGQGKPPSGPSVLQLFLAERMRAHTT